MLEPYIVCVGHNEALCRLSSSFCHALVMKHSTLDTMLISQVPRNYMEAIKPTQEIKCIALTA